MPSHNPEDLDAVAVLAEPLRRALYKYVVAERRDVSRNEASSALGIQRNLAAFHLDKLVDAGLLDASFRRLTERTGPGAGRPAKLYRRASADHSVQLPPRAYPVAAELLAEVVDELGGDAALRDAALRAGRAVARRATENHGTAGTHSTMGDVSALGASATTDSPHLPDGGPFAADRQLAVRVESVLADCGFEPYCEDDKIRLHNCPFHVLSRQFPPLICGMNLALVEGIVDGLGGRRELAHLDPAPDRCCVAVHLAKAPADGSPSNTYVD